MRDKGLQRGKRLREEVNGREIAEFAQQDEREMAPETAASPHCSGLFRLHTLTMGCCIQMQLVSPRELVFGSDGLAESITQSEIVAKVVYQGTPYGGVNVRGTLDHNAWVCVHS